MKLTLEMKGLLLGALAGLAAVSLAFAAGEIIQPRPATSGTPSEALAIPPDGTAARQGYDLFLMNCAHCHGNDARGDEGPDLHGLTKSDARINSIVKNGIKGEMPRSGSKLSDADVKELIAYLRTLKD